MSATCLAATTAANESSAPGDPCEAARAVVFGTIAAILAAAFAIGKQAQPAAPEPLAARMQAGKESAADRAGRSVGPAVA